MKYFLITLFCILNTHSFAQNCPYCPSKDVMNNTDLILEGKVLTDSVYFQNSPGRVYTFHKVLVLKQFKGDFKSDIINIVTLGGSLIINGERVITQGAYAHKGDEAVIFASVMKLGNKDPDLYYVLYGHDGYVNLCDTKKDIVKEIYEPLIQTTGQPYIDIHPNTCATQQKK